MPSDTRLVAFRLPTEQVRFLDGSAHRKSTADDRHTRTDVVRELIAWAMKEGFFGPKKRRGKK